MKGIFKTSGAMSSLLILFILSGIAALWIWKDWDIIKIDDSHKNILAFTGAAIAFFCGFIQYRIGQKWKKTEFLAQEYKLFVDDKYVKRTMRLLDFPFSDFPFDEEEYKTVCHHYKNAGRSIIMKCNFNIVASALGSKYDDEEEKDFDPEMNIIRSTFDQFFTRLGIFQKYVNAGVIDQGDIKKYFRYWIEMIICHGNEQERFPNHSVNFIKMKTELIRFINTYDYSGFKQMVDNFGHDTFKELCQHYHITYREHKIRRQSNSSNKIKVN